MHYCFLHETSEQLFARAPSFGPLNFTSVAGYFLGVAILIASSASNSNRVGKVVRRTDDTSAKPCHFSNQDQSYSEPRCTKSSDVLICGNVGNIIFVEWAQNEIAVVPDFHKQILFSDEAHFWLNGYVNKQNCRIWSEANPQVYVETPLHPEKLTVWCALWAGGIIGPYFFKNDEGHNVTVNGDRYRAMITNFVLPELNNHDVQELWFQQDGATCHTARATIDLLKDTFGDRLISRFRPVNWPPRSCDLTPLDNFCGAM
ncbi:uncharacterized protein TNCV_3275201 [Trichonephila clavipes]|nr:uncharacterized protein TNCV_3275201 [Trichonephila clavipes]